LPPEAEVIIKLDDFGFGSCSGKDSLQKRTNSLTNIKAKPSSLGAIKKCTPGFDAIRK
jgi:hypothetical protein